MNPALLAFQKFNHAGNLAHQVTMDIHSFWSLATHLFSLVGSETLSDPDSMHLLNKAISDATKAASIACKSANKLSSEIARLQIEVSNHTGAMIGQRPDGTFTNARWCPLVHGQN